MDWGCPMRRFIEEEKRHAIDLYFEKGLTTKETVDRLGIPPDRIWNVG